MYFVTRLKLLILSGLLSCSPLISPTSVGFANGAENAPSQNAGQMSREYPPSRSKCSSAQIKKYVSKLGTSALTDNQFEALVKCDSQAVPVLEIALNNSSSDVRASAAYALGQISIRNRNWEAIRVIEQHQVSERNTDVLTILNSYYVHSEPGCATCRTSAEIAQKVQSQISSSSPIVCKLPGIHSILPRCK